MRDRLLQWICCPSCGGELECDVYPREGAEVLEGALTCPSGHLYPIIGGIPRLLDGWATGELPHLYPEFFRSDPGSARRHRDAGHPLRADPGRCTQERFGYEWTYFLDYQCNNFSQFIEPLPKKFFRRQTGARCGTRCRAPCRRSARVWEPRSSPSISREPSKWPTSKLQAPGEDPRDPGRYPSPASQTRSIGFRIQPGCPPAPAGAGAGFSVPDKAPCPWRGDHCLGLCLCASQGDAGKSPVVSQDVEREYPADGLFLQPAGLRPVRESVPHVAIVSSREKPGGIFPCTDRETPITGTTQADADWYDRSAALITNYYKEKELQDWLSRSSWRRRQ